MEVRLEERLHVGDLQGAERVVSVCEAGEKGGSVGPELFVGWVWVCEFEEGACGVCWSGSSCCCSCC